MGFSEAWITGSVNLTTYASLGINHHQSFDKGRLIGLIFRIDFQDIIEIRQTPFTKHDIIRPNIADDPSDIRTLCYRPLNFYATNRAERVVQFYPANTATTVKVYYKYGVAALDLDDVIPFPYDLIVHYICERMLAKDGINSEGQAEHEMLYQQIYEDLVVNSFEAKNLILGKSTADSFTVAGT
jgi:hypothetical protein